MAVYIIDKNSADIAIPYASMDENAKIILVQDGLYIDSESLKDKKVFVFNEEVEERGLGDILPKEFDRIDYNEGIELMIDEKVFSFC